MDIDRARELDDARRIDENWDEGATAVRTLRQKCWLNADFTLEQLIDNGMFYGTSKATQNESANNVASYIWELLKYHEEGDTQKFEHYSAELMKSLITNMEVSQ